MADTPPSNLPSQPPESTPPRRVGAAQSPANSAKGQKKTSLEELDLATGIDRLPELWARHGNKVLIGITIAALGYAFWSFRHNTALANLQTAETDLAQARDLVVQLRSVPFSRQQPERYAQVRKEALSNGTGFLDAVHEKSEDPVMLAQAYLLRGDLNYTLASMPEMDAATTRPSLRLVEDPKRLTGAAKESYQHVIADYPTQTEAVAAAHLGLAALAENEGNLAEAKTQYEAVANSASAADTYKAVARAAIARLPELEKPIKIVAASQPAMSLPMIFDTPNSIPAITLPTPSSTMPAPSMSAPSMTPPSMAAPTTRP